MIAVPNASDDFFEIVFRATCCGVDFVVTKLASSRWRACRHGLRSECWESRLNAVQTVLLVAWLGANRDPKLGRG
ncbi:MAG: hypothetical protein CTY39_10560 [Hyphomicrobium sp.]|nr:MAG: hypothetical protein CTY39_10560 [Hyphomicrobium sp.]